MGPTLVSLAGLVIDLVGAFVLAVQAIGVDRVRGWGEKIKAGRFAGAGVVGLGCFFLVFAVMAALLVWIEPMPMPSAIRDALPRVAVVVLFLVVPFGIARMAMIAGSFMLNLQERARRGIAGLIGFSLLGAGFVLQFIGTLWQALSR